MATQVPEMEFEHGSGFQAAAIWATLLNISGVLLIGGSLTYSVVMLRDYEKRVDTLESQLATKPKVPVPAPAEPAAPTNTAQTDKQIKQLNDALAQAQSDLADANQHAAEQAGTLQAQLDQARSASGSAGDQVKTLQGQLDQARTAIQSLQAQVGQAEAGRRDAEARANALQAALAQRSDAQSTSEGRANELQQRVDELNQQVSALNNRLASAGRKIEACGRALQQSSSDVAELRQRLQAQPAPVCTPQVGFVR